MTVFVAYKCAAAIGHILRSNICTFIILADIAKMLFLETVPVYTSISNIQKCLFHSSVVVVVV